MIPWQRSVRALAHLLAAVLTVAAAACTEHPELSTMVVGERNDAPAYRIGPGDSLSIFVWRNPDLSTSVSVRPDGRVSVPLIEDLQAADKTPTELSRDIEKELGVFIQNPLVTVIVSGFVGTFDQSVRVVGQASQPRSIPYRANMSMLDVMIAVGGLTQFADGNSASLVRVVDGQQRQYRVRLDDLIKDGEISANVAVLPGDILIVPETLF
jgi:polysaccharide export outer membrane protein